MLNSLKSFVACVSWHNRCGFEHLSTLKNLRRLHISYTGNRNIIEAGLVHLRELSELRQLPMGHCPNLQDHFLEHLTGLSIIPQQSEAASLREGPLQMATAPSDRSFPVALDATLVAQSSQRPCHRTCPKSYEQGKMLIQKQLRSVGMTEKCLNFWIIITKSAITRGSQTASSIPAKKSGAVRVRSFAMNGSAACCGTIIGRHDVRFRLLGFGWFCGHPPRVPQNRAISTAAPTGISARHEPRRG